MGRPYGRSLAPFLLAGLVFSLVAPAVGAAAETIGQADSGERSILSIGLAPVKSAYDLTPGSTLTLVARFTCEGTVPLRARVKYMDALHHGDRFEYLEPGGEFWSAGSWVSVEPAEFQVAPGESRELRVTVTVPPGTPDGEYYAAFFVETVPAGGPGAETGVSLGGSIGSLICLAVGENIGRSARLIPYGDVPRTTTGLQGWARLVEDVRYWWRCLVIRGRNVAPLVEARPLKVFAPIENTSAAHIQPRVTASFYEGDVLRRRVTVEGEIILPRQARVIELPWTDAPVYGRFRLELVIEYGGPEPIRVERAFWVLPVKGILGLMAVAFGVGYLSAASGRRRQAGRAAQGP
ncbi:MAG: hypothetical protein AB1645_07080 [Bacillota bacterium]